MQPEPIPDVRITELQEVVDIVPDIGGYLGSLRERSCRLEEEKDAYSRMSLMDSLTGTPNRRALDMRLTSLAELRQAVSLIMLDVDLFKVYNDTLGHQEGDACLYRVAQAMRGGCAAATARSSATAGRSSPWSWTGSRRSMPCMWPSVCARPWGNWASPTPAAPPGT